MIAGSQRCSLSGNCFRLRGPRGASVEETMRRRTFIGCAAGLSLLPCQHASGAAEHAPPAAAPAAAERPGAAVKLTRPVVDIALVCR